MVDHEPSRRARWPAAGEIRADREGVEAAVLELLASWGASGDPLDADILAALGELQAALSFLSSNLAGGIRAFLDRGQDLLPADLLQEVREAGQALESGDVVRAPFLQRRAEDVLSKAAAELSRRVDDERGSLAGELLPWGTVMEPEALALVLRLLWRTESPVEVLERLSALDELRAARASLDAAKSSAAAGLQELLAACAGSPQAVDARTLALGALRSGDPTELTRAARALENLRGKQDREKAEADLAARRGRLANLFERAREAAAAAGAAQARLLIPAMEEAERSLGLSREAPSPASGRRAAAGPGSATDLDLDIGVLESWEKTLELVAATGSEIATRTGRARVEAARALEEELHRQAARRYGTAQANDAALPPEVIAAAAALGSSAGSVAPGAFQKAVDGALSLAGRLEGEATSNLKTGEAKVRASAQELSSLLEESAADLPASNVVQARLRLEMVDGFVASGEIDGIEALERTIRSDLGALQQLAGVVRRRRQNREEAEREALRAEAVKVGESATGAAARRLGALGEEIMKAPADQIERLQQSIARVGGEVEHGIRLEAMRALRSGERLVKRAGGRSGGRWNEKTRDLTGLVETLRTRLEGEDLRGVRESAAQVLASVRRASPLSRPWVRLGIGATALALVAAAFLAWRWSAARPKDYFLKLEPEPAGSVTIALVNEEGEVLDSKPYRDEGGEGVRFALPPGRYEVYVDDRYTGRVIRAGEDPTRVTGIPYVPPSD